MLIRNLSAVLILTGALVAVTAQAGEGGPIDERRPLKSDGRVFVNNLAGEIEVQAWDRNEVRITGRLGEGVEKLEISGSDAELRVEVKLPKNSRDVEDSVLRLQVPAGAQLDLEAVSADISVQGVRGVVQANSVSGDLRLALGSSEVAAQTVSGELTLRAPSLDTKVSTVSGDIHLAGVRGRVQLETVSGDVQISGEAISDMQLKSVSGEFQIECSLAAAPKIEAESLSGSISLRLPKEPDAVLAMRTFSGDLSSAYGPAVPEDKKRVEATLGSGKGRIELNTFSGDISVSKP